LNLLSPTPGQTVSGAVDVTVQMTNFKASCDLYDKPGLQG
jgi:hypothetical protein